MFVLTAILFAVALGFTILGQGGGVLYTPVQVVWGIDFHTAATTSLFLIMVASLSSSLVFRKAKRIDWPLAITLESITVLGGFAGGLASGQLSGQLLSVLFAAVVAIAGLFMVVRFSPPKRRAPDRSRFTAWVRSVGSASYHVNLAVALPISFVAGLASGLVGVGGGILKVPMMVLLFGIPMEIAVGSSAFMVGMTAMGGFAGHVAAGHWDWRTSLVLAAAVFAGGQIGARLSVRIDRGQLKKAFGFFLLVIAAYMVARVLL